MHKQLLFPSYTHTTNCKCRHQDSISQHAAFYCTLCVHLVGKFFTTCSCEVLRKTFIFAHAHQDLIFISCACHMSRWERDSKRFCQYQRLKIIRDTFAKYMYMNMYTIMYIHVFHLKEHACLVNSFCSHVDAYVWTTHVWATHMWGQVFVRIVNVHAGDGIAF